MPRLPPPLALFLVMALRAQAFCLPNLDGFYPEQLQHMVSFDKCSPAEFTAIKEQLTQAFKDESEQAAALFKLVIDNQAWKKMTAGQKLTVITTKFPELRETVKKLKAEKPRSDEDLLSDAISSLPAEEKKRVSAGILPNELVSNVEEHARALAKLSGLRSTLIAVELAEARKAAKSP